MASAVVSDLPRWWAYWVGMLGSLGAAECKSRHCGGSGPVLYGLIDCFPASKAMLAPFIESPAGCLRFVAYVAEIEL